MALFVFISWGQSDNRILTEIVIIGSGNVATQYSYNFHDHQNTISYEIYGRSSAQIKFPDVTLQVETDITKINLHADLYLICVNDDAIKLVANLLNEISISNKAVVAHTSGTKSSELLSRYDNYGVLYPLQTLRKEDPISFRDVPLLVTGNNTKTENLLTSIAKTISGRVTICEDDYRSKLHLPAVVVNNFVNHLYHKAFEYCEKQRVDFSLLMPLIYETVRKISEDTDPADLQTGPAKRDDQLTIQKHIKILQQLNMDPELYNALTKSIIKTHTSSQ